MRKLTLLKNLNLRSNLKEKMRKTKRLMSTILTKSKALLRIKGFLLPIFQKMSHFVRNRLNPLIKKGLAKIRTCFTEPCFIRLAHKIKGVKVKKFLKGKEALGLDIGTNSIKVARLVKTRRGTKLVNFWEKEIPREGKGEAEEEVIVQTIAELLSQVRPAPLQKIISSLPTSSSVIKRLSLPFKGSRRIRQVIRYEMESFLPFPLEEAIIDFYIIDDRLPDRTLVLAFAINKKVIEKHLRILDKAGLRPEVVDLDSTSLFNIYAPQEAKETTAVIDFGASQTTVNVMSEGRLFFTRSIMKAGDNLSQVLTERFGVSFKEAEKLKREGLDEEKLKAIEPVLDEIRKEIEHTFSSFLAFYPDKSIEKILLTGGSARLTGIVEYFQKSLNIETSLFNPLFKLPPVKPFYFRIKEIFLPSLKEISHALDSATLEKTKPLLPQAMGIALRGMARARASLNFIREEKPLIKRLEEARPLLKPATILLLSIFLLGLLDFYLHLYLKNKRSAKLKKEIRLVFKKTFPEVTNIVDPLVQMKSGLEKREEDLALSPREFSSLAILREIASLTPKDLGITIEDLSIDWDETRIRGRTSTPDFSLVDRFKRVLEASDYFTEVAVSDAHLSRRGRSVEFRMTVKHRKE
ncbi:Cell division protein FtsA [subsurface metagenome]